MSDVFVNTPPAPYYAVIFSFTMRDGLSEQEFTSYRNLATKLMKYANEIDGFYGEDAAKGDVLSITVSYWRDEEAIKIWREDARHIAARALGKDIWYDVVKLRVAKVERTSDFKAD